MTGLVSWVVIIIIVPGNTEHIKIKVRFQFTGNVFAT